MNTPTTRSTIRVACRHCGMVMRARREHAGRPAACPRCERVIRLEEAPEPEHPSGLPAPKPAPKPAAPTTTSLSCRVCGTRMAFELEHVGRQAKCPDCGVLNEVPPPPAPPKPKQPRAMQGDQYEVWQGDDQPWGVDLARNAPQRIRVTCGLCQTLIDATPEQIGKQVTCPDCGRKNPVERPKPPPPGAKPNPLVMPAYSVDEAPPAEAPPIAGNDLVEAGLVTGNDHRPNEFARGSRPELPRWPLVQGVFTFMASQAFFARWLALSIAFGGAAAMMLYGASLLAGGPFVVVIGASLSLLGAMLAMLASCVAARNAMAILTESSDGNDRIYQWPAPNPVDGFSDLMVIATAAAVAATPGWAIGSLVAHLPAAEAFAPWPQLIGVAASLAIIFPFVILSQLAASSPWSLLSPEVVAAVPRTLGSWLLLMLQNTPLAATTLAALFMVTALPRNIISITTTPVMAAAIIVALAAIAFRLIGRLAWVVAERG